MPLHGGFREGNRVLCLAGYQATAHCSWMRYWTQTMPGSKYKHQDDVARYTSRPAAGTYCLGWGHLGYAWPSFTQQGGRSIRLCTMPRSRHASSRPFFKVKGKRMQEKGNKRGVCLEVFR